MVFGEFALCLNRQTELVNGIAYELLMRLSEAIDKAVYRDECIGY